MTETPDTLGFTRRVMHLARDAGMIGETIDPGTLLEIAEAFNIVIKDVDYENGDSRWSLNPEIRNKRMN